ncbi:MAG: ureidoglycolate lyase [Alphaproteobacteria bacterium]|nr:ureidoglycolate lyase [Alphaproteobacteria bacterium]
MAIKIKVEVLTQEAFAPFGQVIEMDVRKSFMINEGHTRRYHELAEVDVADGGGNAIFSIFKSSRREFPLEIKMMEHHPMGSQAFMPMQAAEWLVVVSEGDEIPTAETCRAFLASASQGVQYGKGVWHHPLLTLVVEQDFWVVDRGGEEKNLIEHYFEGEVAFVDIVPRD